MHFIGWLLLWMSLVVVASGKPKCFRTELGYEERNYADGGKRSHLYKAAISEIEEAFRRAGTPQKNPFSKKNKVGHR
ncbi:unnamed protein product [Heligmosomoides polygyrus]|uniref:Secreted protein n=1 Tax=Heligmosomoides polygyrus TaxID=6339 RepID=A0A183FAD3_HELPZ|nr:unnamed protein product [Heligmosomoides polygyrus]